MAILSHAPVPRDSQSKNLSSNCKRCKVMAGRRGGGNKSCCGTVRKIRYRESRWHCLSSSAELGITALVGNRLPLIVGFVLGLYLLFSIKVADQWEKVAVLRLGRYLGLRGPGWFHMIPIV